MVWRKAFFVGIAVLTAVSASESTRQPLTNDDVVRLVKAGFVSLELFEGVEPSDLEGAGFTPEEAADIISRVSARAK